MRRAGQWPEAQRPDQSRLPGGNLDRAIIAGALGSAAQPGKAWSGDGDDPRKAVVEPALTFGLDPQRAVVGLQQGAPVSDPEIEFGQREGLLAAREQQRIERPEAQLAAAIAAVKSRFDQCDPPDPGKAQTIDQFDFGAFNRQIGALRIAHHDVCQHLPARPDLLDPVGRGNAPAAQFAPDDVVRDARALGPQDGEGNCHDQRKDRQHSREPTQAAVPLARQLVARRAFKDLVASRSGIDDVSHSSPHLRGSPAKAMLGL